MPKEAKAIMKDCFHLNSCLFRYFPSAVVANRMGIGQVAEGRIFQVDLANTQHRMPEVLSLEIQRVARNPAPYSMLNILTTEGETETCSSSQFEPKITNQSSLRDQ